jgi:hypothetical protein
MEKKHPELLKNTIMENVGREKQSELVEIHYKLTEQGKRLSECVHRIQNMGNKLMDESGNSPEAKPMPKEPSTRLPGLISELNSDADGFKMLLTDLERQINKLEPLF